MNVNRKKEDTDIAPHGHIWFYSGKKKPFGYLSNL